MQTSVLLLAGVILWLNVGVSSLQSETDSVGVDSTIIQQTDSVQKILPIPSDSLAKIDSIKKPVIDPAFLSPEEFKQRIIYGKVLDTLQLDSGRQESLRELMKAGLSYSKGEWANALQEYSVLLPKYPKLKSHLLRRMITCNFNLADLTNMTTLIEQWVQLPQNADDWEEVDAYLVHAIYNNSSLPDSTLIDSLEARIARNPSREYQGSINNQIAGIYLKNKDTLAAREYLFKALENKGTGRDSAFQVLEGMHKKQPTTEFKELLALGYRWCDTGNKTACKDNFLSLLKRSPNQSIKLKIWKYLANTYYAEKDWNNAAKYYLLLVEAGQEKQDYVHRIARSYSKAGKKTLASTWYAKFKEKWPYSAETASMYWVRAYEYEQGKNYTSAKTYYKKLGPEFGKNNKREWAQFRIAFIEYKQGNWKKAIQEFKPVINDHSLLWPRTGAFLLTADSYREMGKDSLARHYYLETIKDFPVSYYAYRARTLLAEHKLMAADSIPQIKPQKLDWAQTMEWIRSRPSEKSRKAVLDTAFYDELEFLLQAGMHEEADRLFNKKKSAIYKSLALKFEFGMLFHKYGQLAQSHRLARSFLAAISRKELDDAPEMVMKWMYPRPHFEEVKRWAKGKTDPLFVIGLMRQESIFDSDISSPVGARGLMQIMPYTGSALATKEGIADKYNQDLLYNPYMAIRLGVRYINDLFNDYKGNPYWVLANYNAGPKPARRWEKAAKDLSQEVAIEEVSYWETRGYLKRCMGNYWTYQAIWSEAN